MADQLIDFLSDGQSVMFMILSILTICGAVLMINFTRVVHMVIALAFTFLSLGGFYLLLDAEFVAFVQVLIYAGAVSILMIFGIMMTRHDQEENTSRGWLHTILLLVGCAGLFGILYYAIQKASFDEVSTKLEGLGNAKDIGMELFQGKVIPFELMSVLLTVAFIGAIILAKREED